MRARAAVVVAATALTVPAAAQGARFRPEDRDTTLISRSLAGGFPNGASRNAAVAQDYQLASFVAFESDATDLVRGDTNGFTDVFLVERRRPYSIEGEPWRPGRTRLVSRGLGGRPANGPSGLPDAGGNRLRPARCVAFVSAASNLVRGDTNGVADAFLYDTRTRRTVRVSANRAGGQADGASREVSVDGSCTRVAYVSDRGSTRQVYLWERGVRRPLVLSRSAAGRPGNGSSYDVSISRGGRDGKPGAAVAFASEATNLDRRDDGRTADVYLVRLRDRRPGPRLVSATSAGRAGNGPSTQPDVALEGAYVAFTTEASDLLPGDTNGVADIARASTRAPGSFVWASKSETIGAIADGPSRSPTTVEPGSVVAFESDATNLQASATSSTSDRNRSRDIFYFAALSRNVSLQSRDSDNGILNNFAHSYATTDPRYTGHQAHAPAQNPQLSYYGNYLLFDSSYPLVDLRVGRARFGYQITGWEAAQLSLTDPALRQIYLRYIGPR